MVAKGECNTSGEPNCGSKTIWGGLCLASLVAALLMLGLSMGMGGCACDDVCGTLNGGGCSEWFGGCTMKGNYKKEECVNYLWSNSCSAGAMPASSGCQFGPTLPFGAAFGMFWMGLLFLILMCVFCCGVFACCCFKGSDDKMAPGVMVGGAPQAIVVLPVAPPPPPAPMDLDTARKELEREGLDQATIDALHARIAQLEGTEKA